MMLLFRIFLLVCFLGLGSQSRGGDVTVAPEAIATMQSLPGSERVPVLCDKPSLQHVAPSLKNINGPLAVAHTPHRSAGGWLPFCIAAGTSLLHQCAVSNLKLIKSRLLEHFVFPQIAFLYPRHSFW